MERAERANADLKALFEQSFGFGVVAEGHLRHAHLIAGKQGGGMRGAEDAAATRQKFRPQLQRLGVVTDHMVGRGEIVLGHESLLMIGTEHVDAHCK